jgi:hypothetical protein
LARSVGRRVRKVGLLVLTFLAVAAAPAAAAGRPAIVATWPGAIEPSSALLRVELDPEGLPTTYSFEYATEAEFLAHGFAGATKRPAAGEAVGAGTAVVSRVQALSGLVPATVYRYRVVAGNSAGTTSTGAYLFATPEVGAPFSLPEGRGWEMVSPIDKNGGEIQGFGGNFGGDVLQAAAAGGSVTYSSRSSFAGPQGAAPASQYLSSRGSSGWTTQNITPASESGAYGDHPNGVPFQLFSSNLASAVMLDGRRCETEPCPRSYSQRDNGTGAFTPLLGPQPDLFFSGATEDLAHLVFSASGNLYERSGSDLRPINILPGDTVATPGAALAAQSRAVSADGSRVYWTDGTNLYLRDGATTLQVDEDAGGGGRFETASKDGAVAYFSKDQHLWRYEAGSDSATDLTPDGGLEGVLGASDDGGSVYYLTGSGLFLWRAATGTSVPLAPSAEPSASQAEAGSYPPTTGTARVSPDGSHLVFVSAMELTNYDNRREGGSAREDEVYLYTAPAGAAPASLVCASCNPTGARPIGPAGIPGASPNGEAPADPEAPGPIQAYKPRVLIADGSRVFFDSFDAMVPQDTNADRDVYEWRASGISGCGRSEGCVNLISSGRAEGGATFVDASADATDAFFLTGGSLVASDPGATDLYDARIGGGFPVVKPPEDCEGDACQPLPEEPEDPIPGTVRSGRPNPTLTVPKKPKHCKAHQVRRKGRCVRKKRHHHHKKKNGGKREGRR